jgi:hypothetical protein
MFWWRSSGTFLLFFGRPRLRLLLASIFNFQDTHQQTPSLDCKQQLSSRPPKNCARRAGRGLRIFDTLRFRTRSSTKRRGLTRLAPGFGHARQQTSLDDGLQFCRTVSADSAARIGHHRQTRMAEILYPFRKCRSVSTKSSKARII